MIDALLKLNAFIESTRESIHEYSLELVNESKELISENIPQMKQIPSQMMNFDYLNDQLSVWDTYIQRLPELEDFFSKIYVSKAFLDLPTITIPVLDVNEIKSVKPQYLTQYTENCYKIIENAINGKIDKETTIRLSIGKDLNVLKHNLVTLTTPDYVNDKDFVRFDNRIVVSANTTYIQGTLLPFIRSCPQTRKDTGTLIAKLIEIINDDIATFNTYIDTVNSLSTEGRIQNSVAVFSILMSAVETYLKATKYVLACLMRKIFIYCNDIKEYATLKDGILQHFPNGESILHESVLEGNYDIADEDIINDVLNGRSDNVEAIIQRVYSKFKDFIVEFRGTKVGDSMHSLIDVEVDNMKFNINPYVKLTSFATALNAGIVAMTELSKDPDVSVDEIKKVGGFGDSLPVNFQDLIESIGDTTFYYDENATANDVCLSVLHELKYGEVIIEKIVDAIHKTYDLFKASELDIAENNNNEYPNNERNKEELAYLRTFEKDLRMTLVQVFKKYLSRLMDLENLLEDKDEELYAGVNLQDDNRFVNTMLESVVQDALCANIDIHEMIDQSYLESAMQEVCDNVQSEKYGLDPVVFYEADQPNETDKNQSTNGSTTPDQKNTNNQTQSTGTDTKTPSTKPVVTDNSNNAQSTNGNNGKPKDVAGIIQKIKDFLNNILNKFKKVINNSKTNLKWLEDNKEGLLNRSYNNVQVDMLQYIDVDFKGVISSCTNCINDMKATRFANWTEQTIEQKLFSKTPLPNDKNMKLAEKLNIALKVGKNGKLEVTHIANGNLKTLIPKMIDYCNYYYGSFSNDLTTQTNAILSALDQLEATAKQATTSDVSASIGLLATSINTLVGAVSNAANTKANDYITVLNSLAPKTKPKDNTENTNNDNSNTNNSNENQK